MILNDGAELSDEQKDIVQAARKFAKEEILPLAAQLDRTGEVTPRSILLLNSCARETALRVEKSRAYTVCGPVWIFVIYGYCANIFRGHLCSSYQAIKNPDGPKN